MWSDNETLSDCIDYNHLITAVTSIIDNPNLLPCSIGVFGDWGSGKSSLMKMIEERYKGKSDILVVRFNGWLFEGYEDAKTVLMGRIVDEIISQRTLTAKGLKVAARLLKKIDVLKLSGTAIKYGVSFAALGPAGLAAMSGVDLLTKLKEADYEKYLTERQEKKDDTKENIRSNIQEFHSNFDDLVKETDLKKIIVFIDDLDRCSPDTIIGTLEAIKLFLFTKNTAFVIGADERLIKYAVRRRFPEIPGDNTEVGRDYLEKLIQYPIRIPPLNTTELINYVNLLFSQLHIDIGEFELVREGILKEKQTKGFDFLFDVNNADTFFNSISEDLKESYQISAQIVPVLAGGLNGNPRQCKRFLNALFLRYNMAQSKDITLNKRILAKLMLLEYFKPETFNSFYQLQAANNGELPNIKLLEQKAAGMLVETEDIQKLTAEHEAYLQDNWLKNWFGLEPTLNNQDLQPYYYFSRDKLAMVGLNMQRMTPTAQEFYRKFLSEAEAVSNTALGEVKALSPGDASAIFESLTQKVRESGKQVGDKSPLRRLFSFSKERTELLSQLISFLEKLPDTELPAAAITWLQDATKDTAFKHPARNIVQKWSISEKNQTLAKLSKTKLKDFD